MFQDYLFRNVYTSRQPQKDRETPSRENLLIFWVSKDKDGDSFWRDFEISLPGDISGNKPRDILPRDNCFPARVIKLMSLSLEKRKASLASRLYVRSIKRGPLSSGACCSCLSWAVTLFHFDIFHFINSVNVLRWVKSFLSINHQQYGHMFRWRLCEAAGTGSGELDHWMRGHQLL